MKHPLLYLVLVMTLLYSCTQPNQNLSLEGADWQFSEIGNDNLQPATVPGVVHTDLLQLGQIPDPFVGNNEDSIQWVAERDWMYQKTFSVPKKQLLKKQHILRFEGIDTYAEITLNDSLLLKTNNAFRTWEIAVSGLIAAENTLKITFRSVDEIEKNKANALDYTLPEAPRVFTRKPQFQYGWDWGPTIKTMGIWRDVSLISYDNIRLEDVFLKTEHSTDTLAKLTAVMNLQTPEYDNCTVEIENKTTGDIFTFPAEVYGPESEYRFEIPIKNPKLWWTHNLGEPFLYHFDIRLKRNNVVIDSQSKRVGIRDIQLVTEKDSIGERFYFKLNDKPVYMKGANYIPQNIFLPEVTKHDRNQLLNDAVAANMNMLRVWGGGVYEDTNFYDLCDEKGILLWQDFMFACAMYPGDEAYLENVKAEAKDNVKRLRQHPSIALWCGNNENSEGWHRWGWQADKTEAQKEAIWSNYQKVFNDLLPSVVDSLNSSISYWESSPKFGRGDPRYQFEGDAHDWWVWHDGYPFEHYKEEVPRFMSEFGFQSFPSYETIKYFTQLDSVDIAHPSFATHQKHSRGFQLIKEYMARDYVIPTKAEDYVYVSQLLQARGIAMGIRAHRSAKPYNMGTLYWQLNDCWPVVSWSSIDGLGNWKALHYEARRVFENVLVTTKEVKNTIEVSIINDSFETITDTLKVSLVTFNGSVLMQDKKMVTSKPNSNDLHWSNHVTDFVAFDRRNTVLVVSFGNERSLHYFEKPKELLLVKDSVTVKFEENDVGIAITVHAENLQKDVFLSSDVPGHFKDNFFDVLPNEQKTVLFIPKGELPKVITVNSLNRINNKDQDEAPSFRMSPTQ